MFALLCPLVHSPQPFSDRASLPPCLWHVALLSSMASSAAGSEWSFVHAPDGTLVVLPGVGPMIFVESDAGGATTVPALTDGSDGLTSGPGLGGLTPGPTLEMVVTVLDLPLENAQVTFRINCDEVPTVDTLKGIIQWYIERGCQEVGLQPFPHRLPRSHWALHSGRRATPWNMPCSYLRTEDMPLRFSWHEWSESYRLHSQGAHVLV